MILNGLAQQQLVDLKNNASEQVVKLDAVKFEFVSAFF
jgi:hypothetical protein